MHWDRCLTWLEVKKDGGFQTRTKKCNTDIAVYTKNRNENLTAKPMYSGPIYRMGVVGILFNRTGSKNLVEV
jgi:hypothetical protein